MTRTTIDEILRQARRGLARLSAADAHAAVEHHGAVLIDTRTAESRARHGRVPRALEISLNVLEWRLDPESPSRHPQAPDLEDLVIVLCEQGYSSSLVAARLHHLGFGQATDVIGGFEAWRAAGLPFVRTGRATVTPVALNGRRPGDIG